MINVDELIIRRLIQFCRACRAGWPSQKRKHWNGVTPLALRRQFVELERYFQVQLFERRAFKLTRAAKGLNKTCESFLQQLQAWHAGCQQGATVIPVRIGAAPLVAHHYLLRVLPRLHRDFPDWEVTCREGSEERLGQWLLDDTIELAVTPLPVEALPGCQSKPLLSLPLALVVPPHIKNRSAKEFWQRKKADQLLVCLEPASVISRRFFEGLRQHHLDPVIQWTASSVETLEICVGNRVGVGVSVLMPGRNPPGDLQVFPLTDFPTVDVGLMWREPCAPVIEQVSEQLTLETKRILSRWRRFVGR